MKFENDPREFKVLYVKNKKYKKIKYWYLIYSF